MNKKLTLTEAGNILNEYKRDDVKAIITDALEHLPELSQDKIPVLASRFYRDGKNMRHCYCPICKEEWEEEDLHTYSYRKEPRCKKCGNTELRMVERGFSITENINYSIILKVNKTNGYMVIATFKPYYTYDMNGKEVNACLDAGNFNFLKGSFKKDISSVIPNLAIFMIDKGYRHHNGYGTNSLMSPVSGDSYNRTTSIYNSVLLNYNVEEAKELLTENGYAVIADGIISATKEVCNSISSKKEATTRKRTAKPNEELTMYLTYKGQPVNEELMLQKGTVTLALLKSSIGTKSTFLRYCPSCGKVTEGSLNNNTFICPECNTENKNSNYYGSSRGAEISNLNYIETFEVMEETDNLVIRLFEINQSLNIDGKVSFKTEETHRFFYTPKKVLVFKKCGSGWSKSSVYDLDSHSWGHKEIIIQDNEEIKNIIARSSMKYTGLAEAWGLTDIPSISTLGDHSRDSYLYLWYKKPCMEQLLKTGLNRAAQDVLSTNIDNLWRYVVPTETSVYAILKITKPVYKIARKMNLSLRDIAFLKKLWEFDNTITEETFKKIREYGSIDAIYDIASRYNIPFVKIIDYIDSCYNNQCIQKAEAIRLWADYLRMAKDMTYRLDNKNTKFPQSLKKEHDRATFAYRVVQNEMNQKRFKEQAEENVKYEYSFDKLFVKVPRTPEEIIEEGTNQKHCVASYVNRVREGDTVVAFIRFKETPDDSYFTIEIREDMIVQVKGYTNSAPTDKILLEFLDKFAKARNLKLAYR